MSLFKTPREILLTKVLKQIKKKSDLDTMQSAEDMQQALEEIHELVIETLNPKKKKMKLRF